MTFLGKTLLGISFVQFLSILILFFMHQSWQESFQEKLAFSFAQSLIQKIHINPKSKNLSLSVLSSNLKSQIRKNWVQDPFQIFLIHQPLQENTVFFSKERHFLDYRFSLPNDASNHIRFLFHFPKTTFLASPPGVSTFLKILFLFWALTSPWMISFLLWNQNQKQLLFWKKLFHSQKEKTLFYLGHFQNIIRFLVVKVPSFSKKEKAFLKNSFFNFISFLRQNKQMLHYLSKQQTSFLNNFKKNKIKNFLFAYLAEGALEMDVQSTSYYWMLVFRGRFTLNLSFKKWWSFLNKHEFFPAQIRFDLSHIQDTEKKSFQKWGNWFLKLASLCSIEEVTLSPFLFLKHIDFWKKHDCLVQQWNIGFFCKNCGEETFFSITTSELHKPDAFASHHCPKCQSPVLLTRFSKAA